MLFRSYVNGRWKTGSAGKIKAEVFDDLDPALILQFKVHPLMRPELEGKSRDSSHLAQLLVSAPTRKQDSFGQFATRILRVMKWATMRSTKGETRPYFSEIYPPTRFHNEMGMADYLRYRDPVQQQWADRRINMALRLDPAPQEVPGASVATHPGTGEEARWVDPPGALAEPQGE